MREVPREGGHEGCHEGGREEGNVCARARALARVERMLERGLSLSYLYTLMRVRSREAQASREGAPSLSLRLLLVSTLSSRVPSSRLASLLSSLLSHRASPLLTLLLSSLSSSLAILTLLFRHSCAPLLSRLFSPPPTSPSWPSLSLSFANASAWAMCRHARASPVAHTSQAGSPGTQHRPLLSGKVAR